MNLFAVISRCNFKLKLSKSKQDALLLWYFIICDNSRFFYD